MATNSTSQPTLVWRPVRGPQERFLECSAYEVLYGGAAGGGKTESLIVCPVRWISEPSFRGLILRRTFPELERSIIDRSHQIYPALGGRYHETKKFWRFPSGARIYFGHLELERDVLAFQSAEFSYIAFDEATHFSENQYRYLLSRSRSSKSLPIRIRAATNPGGPGHAWVFKRWAPWLDPKSEVRAQPGETLHYVNDDEGEHWVEKSAPGALTRTFIPARVTDNPYLAKNDPGYISRLMGLDPVTRKQLRDGNWLVVPARGEVFHRTWWKYLPVSPAEYILRIRRWDLAATEDGGDWTVGLRMLITADGRFVIDHMVRFQGSPHQVESAVHGVAQTDGKQTIVVLPQDPGQAGKAQCASFARLLAGWPVEFVSQNVDKVSASRPASAQCEAGNIVLVPGAWDVDGLIAEAEQFPEGSFDDIVDTISGGVSRLACALDNGPVIDPPEQESTRWAGFEGRGF